MSANDKLAATFHPNPAPAPRKENAMNEQDDLQKAIQKALNWTSIDSRANTPDFELAAMLMEAPPLADYPAPQPRNRSKQRIEGMHRRINEWEAQGHRTVTIAWLRRHFAGFEPGKDAK